MQADDNTTGAEHRAPIRRIIQVDDQIWRVYERPDADDRNVTLVFESDSTIRRVRTFPRDWSRLSDEALFALSWSV